MLTTTEFREDGWRTRSGHVYPHVYDDPERHGFNDFPKSDEPKELDSNKAANILEGVNDFLDANGFEPVTAVTRNQIPDHFVILENEKDWLVLQHNVEAIKAHQSGSEE